MATLNLSIKKWDPKTLGNGKIVLVVGKRGSGKTTLIKNIMYHKRDIPVGVVFNATEKMNRNYGAFVPDLFIHSDYDEEILKKVMKRQEKLIREKRKNVDAFVVFDDMISNASIYRTKTMRELFYNGRHFRIFCICSSQIVLGALDPGLRGQVDIVIILREGSILTRKKIYQNWFGCFPNFESFDQVFQKLTDDYGAMVLDNTKNSTNIEDSIFWFKAKEVPKFRVGSPAFWNAHHAKYNDRCYENDEEDISSKVATKGNRINVVKHGESSSSSSRHPR